MSPPGRRDLPPPLRRNSRLPSSGSQHGQPRRELTLKQVPPFLSPSHAGSVRSHLQSESSMYAQSITHTSLLSYIQTQLGFNPRTAWADAMLTHLLEDRQQGIKHSPHSGARRAGCN